MLRQSVLSILVLLSISIGNADDNNLFIMDYPQNTTSEAPTVLKPQPPTKKQPPQILTRKQAPVVKESAPPVKVSEEPRVQTTTEEETQFINYDYWDLGTEEHLVNDKQDSEVVSSEVKLPEVIHVKPKPRPTPPKKEEPKPAPPKPAVSKPEPKPAPPKPAATKPSGGLRCDKPSGVAAACSQHGIREGLEKVISDCNTVRCYIKLFHMETSCRPFLTHQAIVTAYGMCSIEKDYNLRKRFGSECAKIDTVDRQISCCRKMMKTVGKKYFEPVKVGRLAKCE